MGREHSATTAIDGEDISPASVDTESIANISDHAAESYSEFQTAVSNATAGDVIFWSGDATTPSETIIDTELTIFHRGGEVTLGSDFLRFTDAAEGSHVEINVIDGGGHSNGYIAFTLDSADNIEIRNRKARELGKWVYAHGDTSTANDNVIYGLVVDNTKTPIDCHAENSNVEGNRFYDVNLFDAKTTVHLHGPQGARNNALTNVTVHGTSGGDLSNDDEILEDSNAGANKYALTYLSASLDDAKVTYADDTRIIPNSGRRAAMSIVETQGIRHGNFKWEQWIDKNGSDIDVFTMDDTGRVRIIADESAAGGAAGVLRLDGELATELQRNGTTVAKVIGSRLDMQDNEIGNIGSIDINPANAYSPSNHTTDRTFDADNTSVDELADVVATLLKDLGMDSN
jgi:hypothetical protein